MKLYDGGVYLVNGSDIVEESKFDQPVSREDAAKEHHGIWYSESHNTSEICRNYRSSLIS